jgi:hypothetical protein
MMKGMNGDWVMVLHFLVRLIKSRTEKAIISNEPVDVCFKEHRLSPRLGDHGNAPVVFLERFSSGIDTFFAKCGCRWLLRDDAPIDERKHAKADDSVGTSRYIVVLQSQHLPFACLIMVLWPVSIRSCFDE